MGPIDAMTPSDDSRDGFIERRVTDGRFYLLVENMPARVDLNTGEELFSPKTVEQLHRMLRAG